MEAYKEPANEFWYLSHMRKVAHQTYTDIYQVGLDALILAWPFIYNFHCVYEQWRLWQCCAKAQVRHLQTCMASYKLELDARSLTSNFFLYGSLSLWAVKALAMLRTSECASE